MALLGTFLSLALVALCTGPWTCCDASVLFGYTINAENYAVEDGATWKSANASLRRKLSDVNYTGQRNNATGYLTGGTGRLTDGVSAGPNAWLHWHTDEVKLVFNFAQSVSLVQIDLRVRSFQNVKLKYEVQYRNGSRDVVWGNGHAANGSNYMETIKIPLQEFGNRPTTKSLASDQYIVYAYFDPTMTGDIDISEVTFWERACPIGQFQSVCARTIFGSLPPCQYSVCPGDPAAKCYTNYCSTNIGEYCRAVFITEQQQRTTCSTGTTPVATTETASPPTPLQREDRTTAGIVTTATPAAIAAPKDTMAYWIAIGVLAGVLLVVIAILLLRAAHFHNAKKHHLKISAAAMMADGGRYSVATLSRHFVNFNAMSIHSDRHSNSSCDRTSRASGDSPSLTGMYKAPRTGMNGKPVALTTYSSPRPAAGVQPTQSNSISTLATPVGNGVVVTVTTSTDSDSGRPDSDIPDEYICMGSVPDGRPKSATSYELMNLNPDHVSPPQYRDSGITDHKRTPTESNRDSSSATSASSERGSERGTLHFEV